METFYSSDRAGYVCRVDVEHTDRMSEGECIVLCRDKGDKGEGAAKEKSKPNVANSPGKDRNRGGRKRGDSVKSPPNAPMKLPDANSRKITLSLHSSIVVC